MLQSDKDWTAIADMYAMALSGVAEKLTAMEMAAFVAVGILARQHVVGDDAPGAQSVLDFLQRGAQISLF